MGTDDGGPLFRRPSEEEARKAIEAPGPSWTEYFFGPFLKMTVLMGFLILDSWIAGYWLEARVYYPLLPSLAVALYLEFLGFMYLWHRPSADRSASVREEFRPTLIRPVQFGRWTEEGRRVHRGLSPYPGGATPTGPDPAEFF
jgi:hypothetical protein